MADTEKYIVTQNRGSHTLASVADRPSESSPEQSLSRPRVEGKFIFAGDEKLYIRGVTYGAFRPDAGGFEYQDLETIERDFAQMAASGMNAVRIPHTMPPRSLLDIAQRHGLRVMVGLSAEQYVGYLNDRKGTPDVEEIVREKVRAVAGHPALLCYAIGNEIPAAVVRWLGRRRVERYLESIYRAIKREDPEGIVTYVNYPSTEYLQLPFLDLVSFNVYLESQERLEAYLARLQNLAGERPLLMSEVGLDSMRNGEDEQARVLDWQIRTAFQAGCVGAFIFSWTDEWYRGGADVDDWEFGLTRRDRKPKPALYTVTKAFTEAPFPQHTNWPRISVVVCSYNGARTIRDCCEGLLQLVYPNYEVIVVDDGSTDETAAIANEYGFRVISTENRGLSSARNTGMEAATGEIVAYTDDDARPDPHWLTYLAITFMTTDHAAVGGPNIAPAGDGWIADCVANAPGGPVHVLLSDREAEHVPGCNMAIRKEALKAIGGFDPRYRAAGDDVDVCWRLQERGWRLGFNPAAMVWHHRRNSVSMYWKQQQGYGKAEALLEEKWPDKYNSSGHLTWNGRLYGKGLTQALLSGRGRIYQGVWGSAPFQFLHETQPHTLWTFPLMPEWYLLILFLSMLSILALVWTPLLWTIPLLALAVGALIAQACVSASRASFTSAPRTRLSYLKLWGLTAFLHLMQPLARLRGRLRLGLTPWRRRGVHGLALAKPRRFAFWTEHWQSPDVRLQALTDSLSEAGAVVLHGGNYDRWDMEVRGGLLASVRILMAAEDHGSGQQLVRTRLWPKLSIKAVVLALICAVLSAMAASEHAWIASGVLGLTAALFAFRLFQESAAAMFTALRALKQSGNIE